VYTPHLVKHLVSSNMTDRCISSSYHNATQAERRLRCGTVRKKIFGGTLIALRCVILRNACWKFSLQPIPT